MIKEVGGAHDTDGSVKAARQLETKTETIVPPNCPPKVS